MAKNTKNIRKESDKNYLAKDYASFKEELASYAKTYFSDHNTDFSEASLGGMFVDLAAYVGDSMSFFLDYQFNELDPLNAIEATNILSHAKNAGVKFSGKSPAVVDLDFFIEVPASIESGQYVPAPTALPVILEGTVCKARSGTPFTITDDVDFSEKDYNGATTAIATVSQVDSSGNPLKFIMSKTSGAISGKIITETFTIGKFRAFRKISLANIDVTEIISIVDSDENVYYEVDYLTQNTVFKRTRNLGSDQFDVPSVLEVITANRRFVSNMSFDSSITTLTFAGGDPAVKDNDAIPDPSALALPLYGRTTFQRFSIDPNNLLKTHTLGVGPSNTVLKIRYRHGGGVSHNVDANSIRVIDTIVIDFPKNSATTTTTSVTNSLDVKNQKSAGGGANKQSLKDIRTMIFSSRYEQSRVVTGDDLLSRLYSMPLHFGRVFRASINKSSRNPLSSELYIICRNKIGNLTVAPDMLKRNISTYLNEFRLISDAIDVLDTTVINYGIEYSVVVTPESNKSVVSSQVAQSIINLVDISSYQIDQPLIEADFINAIINTAGVLSLQEFTIFNRSKGLLGRNYSNYSYDLQSNKFKGMIVGPPGSIFELKYPTFDIVGSAE